MAMLRFVHDQFATRGDEVRVLMRDIHEYDENRVGLEEKGDEHKYERDEERPTKSPTSIDTRVAKANARSNSIPHSNSSSSSPGDAYNVKDNNDKDGAGAGGGGGGGGDEDNDENDNGEVLAHSPLSCESAEMIGEAGVARKILQYKKDSQHPPVSYCVFNEVLPLLLQMGWRRVQSVARKVYFMAPWALSHLAGINMAVNNKEKAITDAEAKVGPGEEMEIEMEERAKEEAKIRALLETKCGLLPGRYDIKSIVELVENRDYFKKNKKVIAYIRKHGCQRIEMVPSTASLEMKCKRRNEDQSAPNGLVPVDTVVLATARAQANAAAVLSHIPTRHVAQYAVPSSLSSTSSSSCGVATAAGYGESAPNKLQKKQVSVVPIRSHGGEPIVAQPCTTKQKLEGKIMDVFKISKRKRSPCRGLKGAFKESSDNLLSLERHSLSSPSSMTTSQSPLPSLSSSQSSSDSQVSDVSDDHQSFTSISDKRNKSTKGIEQSNKSYSSQGRLGMVSLKSIDRSGTHTHIQQSSRMTRASIDQSVKAPPKAPHIMTPLVTSTKTLREITSLARSLLDVKNNPVPEERYEETATIKGVIITSLLALQSGQSEANAKALNNVYACGLPGYGKTLTVNQILRDLRKQQLRETEDVRDSEGRMDADNIVLPSFEIITLQGTTVSTDSIYQSIALQMNIGGLGERSGVGSARELLAREKVLARFLNTQQCGGRESNKDIKPTTILMIDEIDKAPRKQVRELLEIASLSILSSTSSCVVPGTPFACNLIVIGVANDMLFSSSSGISHRAQMRLSVVCFRPYKLCQLQSILRKRSLGIFNERALFLIASRGHRTEGGDVRMLLSLACDCLNFSMDKYSNALTSSSNNNDNNGAAEHGNPLENLDELFDGVAVLTDRHIAEANIALGLGGTEALKIGSLTSGARGLLVAMICYGVCDTFAVKGGAVRPVSMNTIQIRSSFTTMLEVKEKTGGIQIGHEVSETNVRNWINELHDCSLIRGGVSSCGGARSFSGGRSDKDPKYVLQVAPKSLARFKNLEVAYRSEIERFIKGQEDFKAREDKS